MTDVGASSPLKACLIAPSFGPSSPPPASALASRRRSRAASSSSSSSSSFVDPPGPRSNNIDDVVVVANDDAAVREEYERARRTRDLERERLVRDELLVGRDAAVRRMLSTTTATTTTIIPRPLLFPRLPPNHDDVDAPVRRKRGREDVAAGDERDDDCYALAIRSASSTATTTTTTTTHRRTLPIEGSHPPRPKSSSLVFLRSILAVEDEPSLAYVPYFGDGDNEDIYSELFDTTERERLYEFGPKYAEEETLGTIDDVLRSMARREPRSFGDPIALDRIHHVLSELADVDLVRVRQRHSLCFAKVEMNGETSDDAKASTDEDRPRNGNSGGSGLASSPCCGGRSKNSDAPVAVPYESIMDSYRNLFCRRCFTYDCNVHGNLPKANIDLLGELAVQKELDGHWKELDKDIDVAYREPKRNGKLQHDGKNVPLTPAQQSICRRAYHIFRGDIEKVAETIGAAPGSVRAYVKSKKIDPLPPNRFINTQLSSSKKNGKISYTSMKNYNPKWLRRIQSKIIHPGFLPCDHDEPCNDETCSCVQNGFFCTKHCGYANKSPNFFRGCACKAGDCRTNACPCYAARRECDPDLCRTCLACCDPPGAPATGDGQRCRNDNISMRRHTHTLIAESDIKEAGFGLFTKRSLKKGDFVLEYVGELISQEEAERRGVIYDKMNMRSVRNEYGTALLLVYQCNIIYLFNLSSDLVIDATRKGNKARYANHSSTPNIEPRTVFVNGDQRIGFYAKHDIDAQSELYFDYRYDDKMDNELIYKPDHSVNFDWMKKNDDKRKKHPKKEKS
ncbi:hypothetical protein ACHAW5_003701 [Stephanodiscus triporus]|uniref:[Histone H3]-lysine(27) N-trimethyltransferase n=1 Tax=Stephanodiscus triporus TaxID=2934178 RepID=A0ABD3QJD0_9STRA